MALVTRYLAPVAAELLRHFQEIVIEGARQVGKRTFAAQIAARGAVVANLDRDATIDAASADPAGFVRQAGDG